MLAIKSILVYQGNVISTCVAVAQTSETFWCSTNITYILRKTVNHL